ncbi:MAG: hypothetical protein GY820_36720 [Gammaproteobacteria bacterium]|nr:hypothetical protein [Gammaproteobacteria bacterium]
MKIAWPCLAKRTDRWTRTWVTVARLFENFSWLIDVLLSEELLLRGKRGNMIITAFQCDGRLFLMQHTNYQTHTWVMVGGIFDHFPAANTRFSHRRGFLRRDKYAKVPSILNTKYLALTYLLIRRVKGTVLDYGCEIL